MAKFNRRPGQGALFPSEASQSNPGTAQPQEFGSASDGRVIQVWREVQDVRAARYGTHVYSARTRAVAAATALDARIRWNESRNSPNSSFKSGRDIAMATVACSIPDLEPQS